MCTREEGATRVGHSRRQALQAFGALAAGTWIAPAVMLVSLIAVPFFAKGGQARTALVASSTVIAALWAIVGQGLYPSIVPAFGGAGHSLTIANASATPMVLTSLLFVFLAVISLVAGYSLFVFVRFRRPVA